MFELCAMQVLLLTPPMTQLNTPYPATAYLTGFLKKQSIAVAQADPAIELVLRLFSRKGLTQILQVIEEECSKLTPTLDFFLENQRQYLTCVEPVIRFLQGKDPSFALRIVNREYLPEGPRFMALQEGADSEDPDPMRWAFGSLGVQDRAKYLASLFIDDLVDVIRDGIDDRFELTRYGEKLAASAAAFDPLLMELKGVQGNRPTLVDQYLDQITTELLQKHQPDLLGLTAPFPGNVYGAFRIAQRAKGINPGVQVLLGGGYVNTELRQISDPRVFDYFDFITLDDGERPFLCILDYLAGRCSTDGLLRTRVRIDGRVVLKSNSKIHDIPHRDTGTPTYEGLPLDKYLSLFEMLNPMHRIWSDGRWNKLTLAHGCYWKKCNFCDISLDYIGRYDPASADLLVDRMQALIEETGQTGFHFVDEAAPPAVIRGLAKRLIERGVSVTWWGNIRFDKTFTPELAQLMAQSGCVAVSGGLEVASDRLLKLMQKGVSVEQVARVTHALTQAGIMVHAYLMYGFPTQTEQETIDSLERVRQLFEAGCIQSAYWHRFSATIHSPIGINPQKFGIELLPEPEVTFARNDLAFQRPNHRVITIAWGRGFVKRFIIICMRLVLTWMSRVWFGKKGIPLPRA
jgi:hypothetical protein